MSQRVRTRMIDSAIRLFAEKGVAATSMSDVVAHSGTPRGSMYHYFPEGKTQLASEATARAGMLMGRAMERTLEAHGATAGVAALVNNSIRVLRDSDFAAGCPILSASLAPQESGPARDAAGQAFRDWQTSLIRRLRLEGVPPARAKSLAALAVTVVEGGIAISRAERSIEPLRRAGAELEALIGSAVVTQR